MKNENEFEFEGKTYIRETIKEGISCEGCVFNVERGDCSFDDSIQLSCQDLHKNYIFKEKQ
jgi:hypothetical protein